MPKIWLYGGDIVCQLFNQWYEGNRWSELRVVRGRGKVVHVVGFSLPEG